MEVMLSKVTVVSVTLDAPVTAAVQAPSLVLSLS